MKNLLIMIIFVLSLFTNALANDVAQEFKLKDLITNKQAFRSFMLKTLNAGQIDSREKTNALIQQFSVNSKLGRKLASEPIVPELVYQVGQKPESILSLIEIFLEKTKLVQFFIFMIGTMFASDLLGELKFFMGVLSPWRIIFSIVRFLGINSVRILGFGYLFKANLAPFTEVYLNSLNYVSSSYPVLHKISHLGANILSSSVYF